MNWIDPKVTLPEEGKVYLILAEIENVIVTAFVTTAYRSRFDSTTKKREKDLRYMYFDTLYSQIRTRAVRLDGKKSSEYRDRADSRGYYYTVTIPGEYRVQNAIGYIEVKDLNFMR